jgi:hypothetical protein
MAYGIGGHSSRWPLWYPCRFRYAVENEGSRGMPWGSRWDGADIRTDSRWYRYMSLRRSQHFYVSPGAFIRAATRIIDWNA